MSKVMNFKEQFKAACKILPEYGLDVPAGFEETVHDISFGLEPTKDGQVPVDVFCVEGEMCINAPKGSAVYRYEEGLAEVFKEAMDDLMSIRNDEFDFG